jgi:glutathionylspermidine synthase
VLDSINNEYQSLLKEEPNKYFQDLKKIYNRLDKENIYYQGEVISILYQPLFFGDSELNYFTKKMVKLKNILQKVMQQYLDDEEFRSYFKFSAELEELILTDPGYSSSVPMGRFDIFYRKQGNLKLCELNADGSSGMVKTNVLEKIFLEAEAIHDLNKAEGYNFSYLELLEKWINNMLKNYHEFSSNNEKSNDKKSSDRKPNIAIMDFDNMGMVSEFEYFKDLLNEKGYQTVIVDPRELKYRQNKLYYQDLQIDLIYRRAVTTDLMEQYSQVEDLLTAYRNQAVCMVGPFRSQIIHNKIIFAILHDEEKTNFLSSEDRRFINQHIPETKIVSNSSVQLDYIKVNREGLVLKPLDFYGAKGVHIGCDLKQDKWENIVNKITPGEYLVQEFCKIPEVDMAVFNNGQLQIKPFKYTLGLFMYNLSFAGIYTRASEGNVIASSTGCVTLPNLII